MNFFSPEFGESVVFLDNAKLEGDPAYMKFKKELGFFQRRIQALQEAAFLESEAKLLLAEMQGIIDALRDSLLRVPLQEEKKE